MLNMEVIRAALKLGAARHREAARDCENLLSALPEHVSNMPTEVCADILRSAGFCVLHRDLAKKAADALRPSPEADTDEVAAVAKLLTMFEEEIAKTWGY